MILSPSNISHFLYHKGFINYNDFQENSFKLIEKKTKNLCFVILYKNGTCFFLKQCIPKSNIDFEMWKQEVLFYKNVLKDTELNKLTDFLPNYIGHCLSEKILVLEKLDIKKNQNDIINTENLNQLIEILKVKREIKIPNKGETNIPWIFNLDSFHFDQNFDHNLVTKILKNLSLVSELKKLTTEWNANAIVHNDLKINNLILTNNKKFKIIDWEMVSLGDDLWDLACLFQSIFYHTIAHNSIVYNLTNRTWRLDTIENSSFKDLTSNYQKKWTQNDKLKVVKFFASIMLMRMFEIKENSDVKNQMFEIASHLLIKPQLHCNLFFNE